MLRRLLGEDVKIELDAAEKWWLTRIDPAQLAQVIMNLALNARDAMAGGGRLSLETQEVLINGDYRRAHPWAKAGRYVLLTVTDTGAGMPPEVVERVFEPFFTTKPQGQGTGLGLSICRDIVREHGGTLAVQSREGQGTTFTAWLPVHEALV